MEILMSGSTFQVKGLCGSKLWVVLWRLKKKNNGGRKERRKTMEKKRKTMDKRLVEEEEGGKLLNKSPNFHQSHVICHVICHVIY
jgi:hypothetical protein